VTAEKPLVALISATAVAPPPVQVAYARIDPDVRLWNILDDRLLQDADEQGGVTDELQDRMRRLIAHAVSAGADGILVTCSLYGFVARSAALELNIPIFGPDDAAFQAVLLSGASRVALVGSLEPSVNDSVSRLRAEAVASAVDVDVVPVFIAGTFAEGRQVGAEEIAQLTAANVNSLQPPADAVLLAQYSLAQGAKIIEAATGLTVYSGPDLAVAAMQSALNMGSP
jgi:hypothetical protein